MKKLCVSIALVLGCLAQGAVAQNMYRNYQSTWVSKPTSVTPDFITMTYLCDETEACSHQFGGKSLQQQSLTDNPTAKINVESGRQFVCEGFEGVIQYSLYDMAGKLLQQGETRNGERNKVINSNGMYILQATDESGNRVTKKLVLI